MKPKHKTHKNRFISSSRCLLILASTAFAHEEIVEPLVSVYAVDPANPEISYDEDPYLYSPPVPEQPTVVYPNGGAPTPDTTDPLLATQPRVTTSDARPDTFTPNRSPWSSYVYYALPAESPVVANGPYLPSGVPLKFDFGTKTSPVQAGYTRVAENTLYSPATGYGWGNSSVASRDRGDVGTPGGNERTLERDFCLPAAGNPFYVDLPDGNYRFTFIVGDSISKTGITVRADGMPVIPSMGAAINHWTKASVLFRSGRDAFSSTRVDAANKPFPMQKQGRVRFEFIAGIAFINSLTIEAVPDTEWNAKPTLFTASDSTVSSYPQPVGAPPHATGLTFMGWGQALPNHFTSGIFIDNQAQPGRSSRSFVEEGILDAILNRIKPGDYLFVMFAINDSADTLPGTYNNRNTKPESTHKAWTRIYINEARKRGARPVLVTSQIKCTYDVYGRFNNSVQGYPQADRELGAELGVPVVDLNKASVDYLTALGSKADDGDPATPPLPEGTRWYRTNPDGSMNDYIHLCPHGANQYARLVSRLVLKTPGLEDLARHVNAPPRPQPVLTIRSNY
jgi:lysophospholipase L1-like esterase